MIYLIGALIAFGFAFQMEHEGEGEKRSWGFVLAFSLLWFILIPWFVIFLIIDKSKG